MRRATASRRGMTLLEVLIAVSLVGLLATGMLFSLRVGLGAMEGTERRILNSRRSSGAQRILESQLGAFVPARAFCGQPLGPAGGEPQPFFQGQSGVMRFVTAYSLAEGFRGTPQIAEILVAPGEGGLGWRLLLNEIPWRGPVGAGFFCAPPVPDPLTGVPVAAFPSPRPVPSSYVLADKLAACRFYFREPSMPGEPSRPWLPEWTRIDQWPDAVRIEMIAIDPEPGRLPPMGIVAQLGVNKPPGEPYVF